MPEHRRKFSPPFKAEAVQMVIEGGRSTAEVARDLGMHDGTLGNWVNAWRWANPNPEQPLTPMERALVIPRCSQRSGRCLCRGILVWLGRSFA